MENILLAFLLTLGAGLSTGIGGLVSIFTKRENTKFLSVCLGFSAGVMIYVSMVEIFQEAKTSLSLVLGETGGYVWTLIGFFGGMLLIALIDKLIPQSKNPHEIKNPQDSEVLPIEDGAKGEKSQQKLVRIGFMTAIAIAIHNFPEGLASFVSATQSLELALPIIIAIAIHNIPEGISVAIPIYYGTGSKKKAVLYSFLSGLAEPLGAVVGFLILLPFMNDMVFGVLFAVIAGIMVFISLDELLPSAREYGEGHLAIYGLVAGMAVMAISLILF